MPVLYIAILRVFELQQVFASKLETRFYPLYFHELFHFSLCPLINDHDSSRGVFRTQLTFWSFFAKLLSTAFLRTPQVAASVYSDLMFKQILICIWFFLIHYYFYVLVLNREIYV